MWTPLTVARRGLWTSAHPAGGRRGWAGIAQLGGGIKAMPRRPLTRAVWPVRIVLARILQHSGSGNRDDFDSWMEASNGRTARARSHRPGQKRRAVAPGLRAAARGRGTDG